MKMVKSLILGSAAGLIAMSGAQAADLPVKAKAVEYVRICSLYGAGFYYIPALTPASSSVVICASTWRSNGGDYGPFQAGNQAGGQNRLTNYFTSRSVRTSPLIPAPRPNTAWFVPSLTMVFSWTTGNYSGSAPGASSEVGASQNGIGGAHLGSLPRVHPVRWIHDGSYGFGLRRTVAELSGWRP